MKDAINTVNIAFATLPSGALLTRTPSLKSGGAHCAILAD
jgi:hypothetical protein